jgi:signal transduction histidine kinase
MKKSSTFLFIITLSLTFIFLVSINLFRDVWFLSPLSETVVFGISTLLIFFIIFLFILREIENNKIKSEFITIVTHKFRTPLTGVRWSIDMLQKDITLTEKKDLLLEMQKANDRLMEIVNLLVGFAKFDNRLNYAFEAISLREIVTTSLEKYSGMLCHKKIKLSVDSDKELPLIIIDKAKIQFVVDMLIDNAIKYSLNEGSLNISFDINQKYIVLRVVDTGIGMSYLDSKRVFKHFFRSKSAKTMDTEGLGLGLYTARKIVNQHKGHLWAESKGSNKGSTFFMELPIHR